MCFLMFVLYKLNILFEIDIPNAIWYFCGSLGSIFNLVNPWQSLNIYIYYYNLDDLLERRHNLKLL